jgi:hypothetical protein
MNHGLTIFSSDSPKFSNFRIIQWWDSPKFFRNVFWTQIATSIPVYEVLQVSWTVIMNQLVAFCSLKFPQKLVHTIVDCVLVLKLCEWEKEGSVFNSCLRDIWHMGCCSALTLFFSYSLPTMTCIFYMLSNLTCTMFNLYLHQNVCVLYWNFKIYENRNLHTFFPFSMSKKIKTIHMHYIQSINNKYYDIIIMQNHVFLHLENNL